MAVHRKVMYLGVNVAESAADIEHVVESKLRRKCIISLVWDWGIDGYDRAVLAVAGGC